MCSGPPGAVRCGRERTWAQSQVLVSHCPWLQFAGRVLCREQRLPVKWTQDECGAVDPGRRATLCWGVCMCAPHREHRKGPSGLTYPPTRLPGMQGGGSRLEDQMSGFSLDSQLPSQGVGFYLLSVSSVPRGAGAPRGRCLGAPGTDLARVTYRQTPDVGDTRPLRPSSHPGSRLLEPLWGHVSIKSPQPCLPLQRLHSYSALVPRPHNSGSLQGTQPELDSLGTC